MPQLTLLFDSSFCFLRLRFCSMRCFRSQLSSIRLNLISWYSPSSCFCFFFTDSLSGSSSRTFPNSQGGSW